ncbi:MAG: hypothetical protein IKD75_04890 [Prevotella sp.]|nr:hypothetical protein [Prevotella sp.]
MKAFKIFSMAAVAFMMVACSSEDTALDNTPVAGQKVHFTATIAAPNSDASTRTTYTEITSGTDAGKIKVAWEQGDEIALIHNGTKDVVTVQTLNADGSANISGDITVGTDGEAVTILYPAATVNAPASGAVPVEDATYATKWNSQDGTLTYIQDYLDYCKATSTLKVSGTKATLNDNISMESTIAIFMFTIQDLGGTDKTATEFKVSDASGNVIATVTPGSATGTLYVALPVMAAGTYWFNATVGGNPYIAKATVATATTAGNYYQTTVKLATVGNIIGADGKFYANKTAVDAAATTGAAMIVYLGSDGETNATYNHGLAIALTDASTYAKAKWGTYNADAGLTKYTHWCQGDDDASTDMTGIANTAALKTLYNGNTDYEAANAVSGYSVAGFTPGDHGFSDWFLPSAGQWYKFLNGMCGLAWTGGWGWATGTGSDNFNTVNAKFTAAGYDTDDAKFENVDWYWSSSEYSLGNAVDVNFDSDYGVLVGHNGKVGQNRVRCFLAF